MEFNMESFNLCARSNLELAASSLQQTADKLRENGESVLACEHENAVGTIRELLNPDGHYYTASERIRAARVAKGK